MVIRTALHDLFFQEMHSRCLRDTNIIPEKSKSIPYGTSTEALLGACSEKKLPNTNQLFYSTKPILTFYIIVLSFWVKPLNSYCFFAWHCKVMALFVDSQEMFVLSIILVATHAPFCDKYKESLFYLSHNDWKRGINKRLLCLITTLS